MQNKCVFSLDRVYRYVLIHQLEQDLFSTYSDKGRCVWIMLNPSTADEENLDPTLRRVRAFTKEWGYSSFVILNLFAFRATLPSEMKLAADPIGPDNDQWIDRATKDAGLIVAGWGGDGAFLNRADQVRARLAGRLHCLEKNGDGSPRHPLYIIGSATPRLLDPPV